MISSIADGDTLPKVYCQNMAGDYYVGVGLFSPFQIGYLMFNEQKRLQLALKVIYLQLPIIEYPEVIKAFISRTTTTAILSQGVLSLYARETKYHWRSLKN